MPGAQTAAATGVTAGLLDDFELDILGQQPLLKIYTQICHCYPLPDTSDASKTRIVDILTSGLERLSANFPWVAGQVVNSNASPDDSGVFHIRPLERTPLFVVKDLTEDPAPEARALTWSALKEADFPMNMLDESVIGAITTFSQDPLARVFAVQATFIDGGVILTFSAHHATMDMVGEANVISWLSKACAGDEFTQDELDGGNMCRRNLIPVLSDEEYEALSPDVLAHQIAKSQPQQEVGEQPAEEKEQEPQTTPAPTNVWANFTFTPSDLSAVKSAATTTLPPGTSFVSTDDALTALIWSSTTRVRAPRLPASTTLSPFARAINIRPYLSLPATYTGLFQNMTYHSLPISTISAPSSLGLVAANLRAGINPEDIILRSRALATFMQRTKDKAVVSFTANMDFPAGIMLSSWAQVAAYGLDFHLGLGPPASVRRPRFTPVASLAYLLPRTPEGDVTVAICLEEGEMEALRRDEEWTRYARYVG